MNSQALEFAKKAVEDLQNGRLNYAATALENALKEVYALQRENAPLVSREGQGRHD